METILGTQRQILDGATLRRRAEQYPYRWLDLGTGDGRYVSELAAALPHCLVVGLDACREPLQLRSRQAPPNALFLVANGLTLPSELQSLFHRVSINFPWGSLLEGLMNKQSGLLDSLRGFTRPGATLELRLNGGAFAERGLSFEQGMEQVRAALKAAGWSCGGEQQLSASQLRVFPSTWARRLAHGPHPWALSLRAVCEDSQRSLWDVGAKNALTTGEKAAL